MLRSRRQQLHATIAKALVEQFPALAEGRPEIVAQHFAEVHRYPAEQIDGAVVALHHPDFVMFETLESYSPRLLLPPINLDAACRK